MEQQSYNITHAEVFGYFVWSPYMRYVFNTGQEGPHILYCGSLNDCLSFIHSEYTKPSPEKAPS